MNNYCSSLVLTSSLPCRVIGNGGQPWNIKRIVRDEGKRKWKWKWKLRGRTSSSSSTSRRKERWVAFLPHTAISQLRHLNRPAPQHKHSEHFKSTQNQNDKFERHRILPFSSPARPQQHLSSCTRASIFIFRVRFPQRAGEGLHQRRQLSAS